LLLKLRGLTRFFVIILPSDHFANLNKNAEKRPMVPDLNKRAEAFARLGVQFALVARALETNNPDLIGIPAARELFETAADSANHNPWFTPGNVQQAIAALGQMLDGAKLSQWLQPYASKLDQAVANPKTVAVVMAGNLPLVGFHDFMCVLISGHRILAKVSSQDKHLPVAVGRLLAQIEPGFENAMHFTEETITGFDAVIATGSNNSSRYFDFYFGKYPHIIRRNRSSAAVITGRESQQELFALGEDVFSYFGLGCRNVSFLLVPEDFELESLREAWQPFQGVMDHHKYANNYDYQKAVVLINSLPHFDTGYCLLQEKSSLVSPISVVHYQRYNDHQVVDSFCMKEKEQIQCITASAGVEIKAADPVPFGKSQQPELWDYADGVDTLNFLINLGG
jgi:hypothetical protein